MTTTRFMGVMTLIGLTMSFSIAPALAAVSVGKGELKGTTLRIEGEDAVSGSTVTVRSSDSLAAVQADNRGRWEIQANNFPVPDCLVAVDDGTGAVGLTLDGCTPAPAPTPEPAPANLAPKANAGPDQTVIDTDGDGFAVVTYNGAASGAAYIFLGGPSGITAASPADADFVLESLQIQAWFGHDVAGGGDVNGDGYSVGGPADVNGDGLSDLIVGVPGFTRNHSREGAAFVHLSDGTSPAPPQVN